MTSQPASTVSSAEVNTLTDAAEHQLGFDSDPGTAIGLPGLAQEARRLFRVTLVSEAIRGSSPVCATSVHCLRRNERPTSPGSSSRQRNIAELGNAAYTYSPVTHAVSRRVEATRQAPRWQQRVRHAQRLRVDARRP